MVNCKGTEGNPYEDMLLPATEEEAVNIFMRLVGEKDRVTLIDNYIIEITDGYGMIIDNTTCLLE